MWLSSELLELWLLVSMRDIIKEASLLLSIQFANIQGIVGGWGEAVDF